MPVRFLEVECSKCRVAQYCPRVGASPAYVGKRPIKCKLIGGYGRRPVDQDALSAESREIAARQGAALTIAEVPVLDADGRLEWEVTKVFSPPVLHEREKVQWPIDQIYPKSHN